MISRRDSRKQAVQVLFFADTSNCDKNMCLRLFCKFFISKKLISYFFLKLVKGVWKHKNNIDYVIERHSNNWKIHRMSHVDRNILRIATFEILYCDDIPAMASINEAVEIGKQFGSKDSGSFINAILDSIHLSTFNDFTKMNQEK